MTTSRHEAIASIESEQSVIGGLMLDQLAWERVADRVSADDFYRHEHVLIYQAIADLIDAGQPVDTLTVSEFLERRQELKKIGGLAYLAALANNTPSAANIAAYAKIVRDKATERRLLTAANEITSLVYGEGLTRDKLDRAQSAVMQIADQRASSGPMTVREAMPAVLNELERRMNTPGLLGLSTGFVDLDAKTSGLQPSDLILVAGRPSMGKTTLAMCVAEHVALNEKTTALIFSMEMSREQLLMRSIASVGRIDFQSVRTAKLSDLEWARLSASAADLIKSNLIIDDTAALTVMDVRARARRVKREHGLGLIVIDYLQLMSGAGENRTAEITHISAGLKALAKELSVPVVALSQLNRGLEQRTNKRPAMSDLRDSGALEQDADVILFLYRDEVYNEDSPAAGTAEVIIGKQRNGPIDTIRLAFNGRMVRFDNYIGGAISDRALPNKRWTGGMDDGF